MDKNSVRFRFPGRLVAAALTFVVAASAQACDGCSSTNGATCGAGTTLQGSTCVPVEQDASVGCGAGTVLSGGECVAVTPAEAGVVVTCGAGTQLSGAACVPVPTDASVVTCGAGTLDQDGVCVAIPEEAGLVCGSGTHDCTGVCYANDDGARCGAACVACATSTPACVSGACACTATSCPVGQYCDDGACVNIPDAAADALSTDDAGARCLGNVTIDFAAFSPYWLNTSTTCGTASMFNDSLVLTQGGSCSAAGVGGWVTLDSAAWALCGDFDVRVNFDLTTFTIPTVSSRYGVIRAFDPSLTTNGISLERYDLTNGNPAVPSNQNYKSWTTDSDDGVATFVPTTDTAGIFRLTRVGAVVTSYHWVAGDGGTGTWAQVLSQTVSSTPWVVELYTGYAMGGGDPANQTVEFANLAIVSADAP